MKGYSDGSKSSFRITAMKIILGFYHDEKSIFLTETYFPANPSWIPPRGNTNSISTGRFDPLENSTWKSIFSFIMFQLFYITAARSFAKKLPNLATRIQKSHHIHIFHILKRPISKQFWKLQRPSKIENLYNKAHILQA